MLKLAYYDIRGLAQVSRLLLAYLKVDYEDYHYALKVKPDGTIDRSTWDADKYKLGLDFPNLPYLIDDEFKITQSPAINKYICRKYKPQLLGKDLKDQTHVEMILDVLSDARIAYSRAAFGGPREERQKRLDDHKETAMKAVDALMAFKKDRKHFVGDYETLADFSAYEFFKLMKHTYQGDTQCCPKMMEHIKMVESLPNVGQFLSSPKYLETRFTPFHS